MSMIARVPTASTRLTRILLESMAPARPFRADYQPQEWEDLWTEARDHCLTPYLHQRWLDSKFIAYVPAATAERFAAARIKNTRRNLRLLAALEELSAALKARGIPSMISKGLSVAQAYYQDIGLRVLYDIDLLIRTHDREEAFEVMRGAGYVPFFENRRGGREQTLFWRPEEYVWDEQSVFDPGQPVFVELHTSPWERRWHGFRLECKLDLWQNSRVEEVFGIPFRVPIEERLLVHLAVHYACNVLESNGRLMHLLDIVLLLRKHAGRLNWDLVLHDIKECRAAAFCFIAFDLAGRVGAARIPINVWAELKDATPREIAEWLGTSGVEDVVTMNLHHRRRALIHSLHWHTASGVREKAGVLFHSLCSPWHGGAGLERWKLAGRRIWERVRYLACPSYT